MTREPPEQTVIVRQKTRSGSNAAAATGAISGIGLLWLWNGYVLPYGWGPEMTGEVAVAIALALDRLFDRVLGPDADTR